MPVLAAAGETRNYLLRPQVRSSSAPPADSGLSCHEARRPGPSPAARGWGCHGHSPRAPGPGGAGPGPGPAHEGAFAVGRAAPHGLSRASHQGWPEGTSAEGIGSVEHLPSCQPQAATQTHTLWQLAPPRPAWSQHARGEVEVRFPGISLAELAEPEAHCERLRILEQRELECASDTAP
jgi:hypothetical protein